MLLFPTQNTKTLINKIIEERLINANDQMLLNYLVTEKKFKLSYDLFDYIEFPVGYLYFNNEDCVEVGENLSKVIDKKNEYLKNKNKNTYFVHANWMIGSEKKISNLKKYNLWFI